MALYSSRIHDVLTYLDDPTFDYTQFDSQLFRELHCGRLTVTDTLRIYKKLVEKHNYSVTAKDLSNLIHFTDLS